MALMGWDLDTTLGKLHRFWWWCLDYAEDGDLRRHNNTILGSSVGLNGDQTKKWVEAMVESGWIDREPYFRVHDWWDLIGLFLRRKYEGRNNEKWKRVKALYEYRTDAVQQAVLLPDGVEIIEEKESLPPDKEKEKFSPHTPLFKEKEITPSSKKEKSVARAETKVTFGEHRNVRMTEDQHQKLIERFGEKGALDWITELDLALGSSDRLRKKYTDHYLTILSWNRKEYGNGSNRSNGKPSKFEQAKQNIKAFVERGDS